MIKGREARQRKALKMLQKALRFATEDNGGKTKIVLKMWIYTIPMSSQSEQRTKHITNCWLAS